MYRSLAKEEEHLTSPSKRGVGVLSSVLHLTTKDPCHVYSDSMPPKQVIRQTIMYNRATSGFKVKAWRHNNTLNGMCHHEYGVARGARRIRYDRLRKAAL